MDTVSSNLNNKEKLIEHESELLHQFPNNDKLLFELGMCHFNCNEFGKAFRIFDKLLQFPLLPLPVREKVIYQHHLCVPHVVNDYVSYPEDIVKSLVGRSKRSKPLVTFTITTCKRMSLFEPTLNSFLRCCSDIELIDEWLCVDDNSSQDERERMQHLYPFFTFYFKCPHEKGHPESMNLIQKLVRTPYVFHMEDDWKFYCVRNYMGNCLEVLSDNPIIGQCLININYTEIPSNIECVGGYSKVTSSGLRYVIQEHTRNQEETNRFYKKYGNKANCAYWPHYSFRPSLLRTSVWELLGPFDEEVSHFEMVYAYKYRDYGYVSAFLDGIHCMHTGRLTSQKDDKSKLNAYDLNNEIQFGTKVKKVKDIPREAPVTKRGLFTYVLNLDRRADRWCHFSSLESPKFLEYVRVPAIDGMKLVPTEQLQRIFDGNDYNMRRGMVGCAMSHISLYINFVNELSMKEEDMLCVLEDDAEFVPNFQEKFTHLLTHVPCDWDLIYLGHHVWKKYITEDTYDKDKLPSTEKWDAKTSLRKSMGGTAGYIITKTGARKLLEFINRYGMTNGIDTVQQKAGDVMNIYYCSPHLVYSSCYLPASPTDTDIQTDFSSLTIPVSVRFSKQMEFYRDYKYKLFTNVEQFKAYISTSGHTEIAIYQGMGITEAKTICIYPYYTLNDTAMFVIPKPTPIQVNTRWFDRVKKNGVYTVNEAIRLA